MSLSDPFIKRPVATILVMLGIVVFGLVAYTRLPVSDLPTIDFPTISVQASLPGASPETMASAVATPLEKQFSTIAGIDAITSISNLGSTQITLQFTLDRDIDAAAQDVQSGISQAIRDLPPGMIPPSARKVNPAAQSILYFALTSDQLPMPELNEYGETMMAQRISMVPGVAQVQIFGSQKYAVRIQIDPMKLAYQKIGIDEVASAISSQNVNMPTGVLWGPNTAYTVQATGQLQNAAGFRELVVTYRNGVPVKLGAIADVLDDVQNNKLASWYNGKRGMILGVQRQPGTNTVAVATAVNALVAQMREQFPPSVKLETLYDRSVTIEESVRDVKFTLVLTLALVVMVIFLFLRNVSATAIPSLALPISVIGTFAVMYALGYSLDNLSLMALTLAVGFVVDDAIVMLENIVRHMEMGKPPMEAAFVGAREVGFTIFSMTLSLTAVFIPILFLGGIVGRLFHEFAVVIAVSILVSGFVSLTLTPMLSSRFLRPHAGEQHGRMYTAIERFWERVLAFYARTLGWVMHHRRVAMVFSLGILVGTVALYKVIPKGFLPSEDTGRVNGTTEAAQGTSYDEMVRRQQEVAAIVAQDTNISGFMSSVGGGGGANNSLNQGRFFIGLKPHDSRVSADEFIQGLRAKLSHVPGMQVFLSNPPTIQIGARTSKGLYQFTMQSGDLDELYASSQKLVEAARGSKLLQDVTSDLQLGNPQASIVIERERAASLGVSAQQIESALYNAYGSRQVSTIYAPNNEYWVEMELMPKYQTDLSALSLLHVRSSTGAMVPLSAVATVSQSVGAVSINHAGQLPAVTMSFDLPPGVSIGDAVAEVEHFARETLPGTVTTAFTGTAQAFQDAQGGLLVLLAIAVFVIYVVLGILYESFIHPLTILSGLPFAAFGALLTLYVFHVDLSVYAFVGIILLVGLVKKNAIMMVDFAIEAEKHGKSPDKAIVEACLVRFRPIMMTTMAAFMGTLPIALSAGAGSESRRPLGIAVVGGLAFSQVITLYVTPVVYMYMHRVNEFLSRRSARTRTEPAVLPVPSTQVSIQVVNDG